MTSEPVLILSAVQAAIALIASFGFHLTGEQIGAIMALASAIIGIITRSQVTPTSKL